MLTIDPTSLIESLYDLSLAQQESQREALQHALIGIDRARTYEQRNPECAVELRTGLIAGRWSIVEHFERNGQKYYLAHRNEPSVTAARRLSVRETQVLRFAELGFSNKLIGYTLGLSTSSVSKYLSRARRKLGASCSLDALSILELGNGSGESPTQRGKQAALRGRASEA